jgi:hypothetical protein
MIEGVEKKVKGNNISLEETGWMSSCFVIFNVYYRNEQIRD